MPKVSRVAYSVYSPVPKVSWVAFSVHSPVPKVSWVAFSVHSPVPKVSRVARGHQPHGHQPHGHQRSSSFGHHQHGIRIAISDRLGCPQPLPPAYGVCSREPVGGGKLCRYAMVPAPIWLSPSGSELAPRDGAAHTRAAQHMWAQAVWLAWPSRLARLRGLHGCMACMACMAAWLACMTCCAGTLGPCLEGQCHPLEVQQV